jgi:hypothetical protein
MDARMLTAWRSMVIRPAIACLVAAHIGIAFATAVHAVPVFYLSNQTMNAVPGLLNQPTTAQGLNGKLHIWVNSDVRLSGISLDLIETGGGIRFTGVEVPNPNQRWALFDSPRIVSDSAVTNIGGAAIPQVVGKGVGQGSPEGANVLIASVDYFAAGFACCGSQLSLRVGSNGIADWDGNFPQLRFGSQTAPILKGDQFGASSLVGLLTHTEAPLIPVDANLGNQPRGDIIDHKFTVSSSAGDVVWSNLVVNGPGTPAIAPSLGADGRFIWNTAGSPLGAWTFDATVRDQFGPAVGHLTVNLVVPEPTTCLLALVGLSAFRLSIGRRHRKILSICAPG